MKAKIEYKHREQTNLTTVNMRFHIMDQSHFYWTTTLAISIL